MGPLQCYFLEDKYLIVYYTCIYQIDKITALNCSQRAIVISMPEESTRKYVITLGNLARL